MLTAPRLNPKNQLNLQFLISLLPKQGCIEIQRDEASKTHDWHSHDRDETLLIIKGSIQFSLQNETINCFENDYMALNSGTRHKSLAGAEGCVYVIAFEKPNTNLHRIF